MRHFVFHQESKIPVYQHMWSFMESNERPVFLKTSQEGIDRVLNDNYAFLMESTMIDYNIQRNCELMQVGGLLDSKGYGIGTPIGRHRLQITIYFTLVGVVSSDVSRSSCTTSFTPCCSIFSQSYVFFKGCPCPLLDVIDVLHPGAPSSSFPRHHSENTCLY